MCWPSSRPTFPETDDISDGRSALHVVEGTRLDWVIVGGESGPGARPMHPDWPRQLRDQCAEAGTALFFKQWGEFLPGTSLRVGKKAAGRELDGRTHDEFPA